MPSAERRRNHERYASWLAAVVAGGDELALHDLPLVGFVRIVTNSRIVPTVTPTALALDFVGRLRTARRARWLSPAAPSWERFRELVDGDRGITGNVTPDAYLASLALTHGCRLATADRGFRRFPTLDWFDPAA